MNLPAPAESGPAEMFALHNIDNPVLHKPVVRRELNSKESRLISLLPSLDDDDDDGDDEGERRGKKRNLTKVKLSGE